jgi:hypothetical protein
MLQIQERARSQFDALLVQREIPLRFHSDCRKWLGYYLDFCRQYGVKRSSKSSLLRTPHLPLEKDRVPFERNTFVSLRNALTCDG